MGIQIKGSNDTISAADGTMTLEGQTLAFTNENITGISTMATGHITGTTTLDDDLKVGISTLFVDKSTGRTGIGTISPSDLLTIVHSANTDDGISIVNTNNSQASAIAQLELSGGDNAHGRVQFECNGKYSTIRHDGNGHLAFYTNGSNERLRITSNGSVGINSTSPPSSEKLTIRGGASDSGKFTFHSYADFLGASDAYLGLSIIARGANASNSNSQWTGIGASTSYGWINFAGNGASQISMTSSKVGIGTDSPARHLDIKDATGANRIVNVRGTGTSGAYLAFLDANTTDDSKCRVGTKGGNNIALRGDEHHFEKGDGTSRMVIDSSGNVTKPSSFHILVRRSGNLTGYSATGTTGPVIWNNVVTNESSSNASNHFNTTTGIFTAPVTGLYFFHAAVNCNYSVEGAWLIINGSRANYSVFNPNNAQTSDGTITYHLTAGDEVGLKWYDNGNTNATINANDLHTWWRIILLG